MSRPNFQQLWNTFPDHIQYPTMGNLYRALGGTVEKNINADGFGENGNACASRLSVAFSLSGAPIDDEIAKSINVTTIGTAADGLANGHRIIFRVAEFRKYLRRTLGQPITDATRPYGDAFVGKKGIIAFLVNFRGATGHIALWNGKQYRESSDDYSVHRLARASEFWEIN